jgi:hypothetical protein
MAIETMSLPRSAQFANRNSLSPLKRHQISREPLSLPAYPYSSLAPRDLLNLICEAENFMDGDDVFPDPTPIALTGVTVVNEVTITENTWHNDHGLIDLLLHSLLLREKRKMDELQPTIIHAGTSKRQRTIFPSPATLKDFRFRSYQSKQWMERFEDLIEFQRYHGHCLVPHDYAENPALAQWIKRQRYQHTLKSEGKHSTLTDERQAALEAIGCIWDSHRAAWEERFNELCYFKERHCNVPSKYDENQPLAIWVKCQRRQYKVYCKSEKSNMTQDRLQKLILLGFVFNPRRLI